MSAAASSALEAFLVIGVEQTPHQNWPYRIGITWELGPYHL